MEIITLIVLIIIMDFTLIIMRIFKNIKLIVLMIFNFKNNNIINKMILFKAKILNKTKVKK
jgi:hypothetical protein